MIFPIRWHWVRWTAKGNSYHINLYYCLSVIRKHNCTPPPLPPPPPLSLFLSLCLPCSYSLPFSFSLSLSISPSLSPLPLSPSISPMHPFVQSSSEYLLAMCRYFVSLHTSFHLFSHILVLFVFPSALFMSCLLSSSSSSSSSSPALSSSFFFCFLLFNPPCYYYLVAFFLRKYVCFFEAPVYLPPPPPPLPPSLFSLSLSPSSCCSYIHSLFSARLLLFHLVCLALRVFFFYSLYLPVCLSVCPTLSRSTILFLSTPHPTHFKQIGLSWENSGPFETQD